MTALDTGVKINLSKDRKIEVQSPHDNNKDFKNPINTEYSNYINKTLNNMFLSFGVTL